MSVDMKMPLVESSLKTPALNDRAYVAVGQASGALHTMAVLQAYQADLLKDSDEGRGLPPEAVKELWCTTNLTLHATKQTAAATGSSMAAMVAMERHLWINLAAIRKKEKSTKKIRQIVW